MLDTDRRLAASLIVNNSSLSLCIKAASQTFRYFRAEPEDRGLESAKSSGGSYLVIRMAHGRPIAPSLERRAIGASVLSRLRTMVHRIRSAY